MFDSFEGEGLTDQQKIFVNDFIVKFNKRTNRSKQWMATYNSVHADAMIIAGYRASLKALRYPILADRSSGARIWDIDGNEYIDLAMGYGVNFLGHNPPFVIDAIKGQLRDGIQLGPQFHKTGKLAKLISEMTGAERVFFSNTGTEAVMSAARIARACTGRAKIAIFEGSFYGHFDGLKAMNSGQGVVPKTLGTPRAMVEDIVVLKYGSDESLETLKSRGHEIAGVFVEPFQGHRPDLKPSRQYVQDLAKITKDQGAALIFNEITTGFRFHHRGAAAYFNVTPDIALYGKFIAGGMPMSLITGTSRFMNMIDGGIWNFGDDSHPDVKMTSVAGTFCKHPLAVAAACATLEYLKARGPSLQETVNRRMEMFANRLNTYFSEERVPIRLEYFGSLFHLQYTGEISGSLLPLEFELFFYLLLEKGVFTWEMRVCCLSAAHTDEDMDFVFQAVRDSVQALREGGFLFYLS